MTTIDTHNESKYNSNIKLHTCYVNNFEITWIDKNMIYQKYTNKEKTYF